MDAKFSPRVREVIGFSREEALRLGHNHIGIEHMIPAELMVEKVREAVRARRSRDFLVIARTNGVRSSDMEDALRRAEAY